MVEHHVQFDRQVKNCRFMDRSEPVTRTVDPVAAEVATAAVNERMNGLLENIATGIDSIDSRPGCRSPRCECGKPGVRA